MLFNGYCRAPPDFLTHLLIQSIFLFTRTFRIILDGGVFYIDLLFLFGLSVVLFLLLGFQFTKQHRFIAATGGLQGVPPAPHFLFQVGKGSEKHIWVLLVLLFNLFTLI